MIRTQTRPIPSGRMLPREGLIAGTLLGLGGVLYLALAVNLISAALAAATIGIYLFAYTPLKRISTANTLVGAIPGALPPLIGWAAAATTSRLPPGPFRDSFFLAIAALFRDRLDVSGRLRASWFRQLGRDEEGARTGRQSIIFTLPLLLASVTPIWAGIVTIFYLPIALLLGALFLGLPSVFKRPAPAQCATAVLRLHYLSSAPARSAGPDQTRASFHARANPSPLSWRALFWKSTLFSSRS